MTDGEPNIYGSGEINLVTKPERKSPRLYDSGEKHGSGEINQIEFILSHSQEAHEYIQPPLISYINETNDMKTIQEKI